MKIRSLFLVNAIVQFLFGLGFLLTPTVTLSVFSAGSDATGTMLTRVAGGLILSLGLISWLGKDTESSTAQNAMVWGFLFAHLQAGFFTTLSVLNGSFNALGWSAVLIDLFFVITFSMWLRGKMSR